MGLFEKFGATFRNVWFSFGAGEYDLIAVVEVPADVDVAALSIAAQADWPGKPFDKISITPLLSDREASAAIQRAAQALATLGDATTAAPPPCPVIVDPRTTADTAPHLSDLPTNGAKDVEDRRPEVTAISPRLESRTEVVTDPPTVDVSARSARADAHDSDDLELLSPGPAPVNVQADAARRPRWWRTPAAAVAAVGLASVLAAGGYFAWQHASHSKGSPTAAPAAAAPVPAYLPSGATACKALYTDIHLPFDTGARGTPTTSCPFVEQVRRTYAQLSSTSAPTDQLHAISPSTGKWYELACIPTGGYVTCTGGAAAVIYLYHSSR
ncbi:MAG: hypothetical protein U0Q47_07950 [Mycobacterium sp.]